MKRLFFALMASAAILAACQKETPDPTSEEENAVRTVSINAGTAGTKTGVVSATDGYSVTWKAGDKIALVETIYANFGGKTASPVQVYTSEALTADTETATFSVTMGSRDNPDNDKYRYVAVYPSGCLYAPDYWTGDNRSEWESKWGNTTLPDHSYLMVEMPTYQRPTANSFDPNADLLVSKLITSDTPATGSMTMQFARVGTIVKITVKGLPAGAEVSEATFKFDPDDWIGNYMIEYDPELGKVGYFGKTGGEMFIRPQGVTVASDGTADLWLRTFPGKMSTWFSLDVTVSSGKDQEQYAKRVDLVAAGKSIAFEEGGMTKFSVTLARTYTINMYNSNLNVGETSVSTNIVYNMDGAPMAGAEYGLIKMTGDDASAVTLEAADAADIIKLTPSSIESGTVTCPFSLSGLTPSTTYKFRGYVKLGDGTVCYQPYGYFSYETLSHIDYAVPALVDLGLPSGVKWASFNLGASSPEGTGHYFAYGSNRKADSFSGYTNKYWYQYNSGSKGYARKYATDSRYAYDDALDLNTTLDPEDDAATANLGSDWRTPTSYDFEELLANCNISTTYVNSVKVIRFTSRINSATLDIPFSRRYSGGYLSDENESYLLAADIWMSDGFSGGYNQPAALKISSSPSVYHSTYMRHAYYNIRPVSGGTAKEHDWVAHVGAATVTGSTVTFSGDFIAPEDAQYDYTYVAHIYVEDGSNLNQYQYLATKATPAEFTGLASGTTYYYAVVWNCYAKGTDNLLEHGTSEIRKFTKN